MENDIYLYYANAYPGYVTVLGPDCWNGTFAQLTSFKNTTGATYPLLLNGGSISTLYGIMYDDYLVIDQNGIIRYISPYTQPQGTRYDLNAIRTTIGAYLPTAVQDPSDGLGGAVLQLWPNPLRSSVTFEVTRHTHDTPAAIVLAASDGRVVRRLALLGLGTEQVVWDGRDARGRPVPNGVYEAVVEERDARSGRVRVVVLR